MIDSLETPIALVDLARVRANLTRVSRYAATHQLRLRPHTKTHKLPVIAQLQLEAGAHGLTVATAREAEVMLPALQGPAASLLVAYPPVDPARLRRLAALRDRRPDLELDVALDSAEALTRLSATLPARSNHAVGVLIELDLGGRRTGVVDLASLVRLARLASDSPRLSFRGILFHPGHLRHEAHAERTPAQPATGPFLAGLHALASAVDEAVDALSRAGLPPQVVSGGNTPTLYHSHLIPRQTEIRPGTYVYGNRDTASQGLLGWHDCAYSVLATVISTAVPGQAVIDAGSKALSKEALPGLKGWGALLERPDVVVSAVSEEHGVLALEGTDFRPRVGDRVRVVPNHVCVSVNLQDDVVLLDGAALRRVPVAARGH